MLIVRVSWLLLCGLMIQGCAGSSRPKIGPHESNVLSPSGKLDFGWKLSGARSIGPVQMFSDASRIWLQWSPQQTIPIILATDEEGEHVLPYTQQNPYTIIAGHWPRLTFRHGQFKAQARHIQSTQDSGQESLKASSASQNSKSIAATLTADQSPKTDQANSASLTSGTVTFSVTPEDQNLRQTLVRWAGISGWHFQTEHWGVDVDIPLAGGAKFGDDFITSVQSLVGSTELSDRPLQPCFYANQVLRVIALSEPCDRTTTPAVAGAPA